MPTEVIKIAHKIVVLCDDLLISYSYLSKRHKRKATKVERIHAEVLK